MNTADNTSSSKKNIIIGILLLVALTAAILSSLPTVQTRLQSLFATDERQLLAKIEAFYGPEQTQFLILKVKNSHGISVEIYQEQSEAGQQIFRQKFDLLHDSDVHITIDKNATNLALSDVDQDGHMDILAPSVDRNGNLRLNTFRYNSDLHIFEPMTEDHSY
ncbi:hypothetical protein [Pseudobdellovibrio exovorus]|uniref:VCBS repeat-containing protein n=1 Tax=Pseudobdellovibrio exovorus JSS TaxID=1184267 RepID=M4VB13_9BACT|nr:hypothetical protein [Pseudobdellovibrio exovorus]AGH96572.1 hypothetical protein A11Q_2356 [Pseudobdellovibrio exovorus JSS]